MIKLLLVDDEVSIIRSLERLFIDEEFETITANSGEEALGIIKSNSDIGLIISDMRMPGMTGADLLKEAKEIIPDAIRIILTGYADISSAIDAINKGGAYRYISKPWDDDEILRVVKDGLDKYKLIIENQRLSELVKKQKDELVQWNVRLSKIVQEQNIDIVKKNERLKGNFNSMIIAFTELVELRHPSFRNHARHVAELSVKIAEKLELSHDEIENIRIAALLHDIGKIGFKDELLCKNFEDMKPLEIKEYMCHPVRGQAAIDSVEDLRKAGVLIRHHHESFNGRGFPGGLQGKNIPIGARVIGIADFIDKTMGKFRGEDVVRFTMNKVKEELVRRFDPTLFNHIEEPIKELYKKEFIDGTGKDKELHIEELREGMVISRDIITGSGFPFLSKGTVLTPKIIESIKRYYQLDPSQNGVFVISKENK